MPIACCKAQSANDPNEDESNKCLNLTYDILTILISIADVTTDIIVLVLFYLQGRTTFFTFSLVILIVAQTAYALIFMARYKVLTHLDNLGQAVLAFLALLPFGTFIAFIIYFTDNTDSWFAQTFERITGLSVQYNLQHAWLTNRQSVMTTWMIKKLSKHIGFIVEAGIEALPQSLLQITAIVYYKEANYISIASIFISMFSVASKSLVFSQGIDIKTYIWTWLCIVIDFFGIFFCLSFVFYTNNTVLTAQYLGSFTPIGFMWFIKVMVSVVPIVSSGYLWWFCFGMWRWVHEICVSTYNSSCEKVWYSIFIIFAGSFGALVAGCVAFLALEIFCFSFLALVLFLGFTRRWNSYTVKNISDTVNSIIQFIATTSVFDCKNDRMLRVVAVNKFIAGNYSTNYNVPPVCSKINEIERSEGVNGLKQINYGFLRDNCGSERRQRTAKIFPLLYWLLTDEFAPSKDDWKDCIMCRRDGWKVNCKDCFFLWFYIAVWIQLPVFIVAKLFQAIFPYVIVAYLMYEDHLMDINMFQFAMLATCIGLHVVLLVLGVMVCRIHFWLWHIDAGRTELYLSPNWTSEKLMQPVNKWYATQTSYPLIEKILMEMYGDIGRVIMEYFVSIDLS
eukprot:1649_1